MAQLKSGIQVNAADLARLNRKMRELIELDEEAVPKVMKRTGEAVVREMRAYAPYKTGRLKTNIDYEVKEIENFTTVEFESEAIDPETKIDYAPIQEFGTRLFRGSHYFMPAVNGAAQELYHRINQAIKTILRKK